MYTGEGVRFADFISFSKISHENERIWSHQDQICSFHRIFKNRGRGEEVQANPLNPTGSATVRHMANACGQWRF